MELKKVFSILKKHWVLIYLTVVLCVLGATILTFFILDDIYQSTATAIVITTSENEERISTYYDDYMLNTKLVNSYSVLCKTNHVLLQVINQLNLDMSVNELSDMITVSSQQGTEFLHIIVENKDAVLSMNIANTIVNVFQQEVKNTMNRDNVRIVDYATESNKPVRPDKKMNIILALMSGILLGVGISFFKEYLDDSINSIDQLKELFNIPVLGTIPRIKTIEREKV